MCLSKTKGMEITMEKILIIDDSRLQAEALKSILDDTYSITIAETAREGLAKAQSRDFSMILLDIVMPDMDGFTLLKELEELMVSEHVPVIMITSLTDIQSEEKGLMLGAVDYITKPFNPIIVKARVNAHIKLHRYQMQIREMAMFDELTGVANRRNYENICKARWNEAVRMSSPFSVCMIDIDKFKVYNDTFGHPAGDKTLATVAKTISAQMHRATDFFARYGGEEFVAILTGGMAMANYTFMRKVRRSIEDLRLPHNSSVSPWVTISCGGITIIPGKDDRYEDYLQIADQMLYDAKQSGRNMVVWSDGKNEQWKENKKKDA